MSTRMWAREEIVAFAARYGMKVETDAEIERMVTLGARVTNVAVSLRRMTSKDHEPASIFKVPL